MSGITLYAKDFQNEKLSIQDILILKTLFYKDKSIYKALFDMFGRNTILSILMDLQTQGYVKILTDAEEIEFDDVVLRSVAIDLFKEENDAATEVLTYLNSKILDPKDNKKKGFSLKSPANKKFINARLNEGYSVEDMKKVIDVMSKAWGNTSYYIYLRPETLFSPTKFQGYLVRANKEEADGESTGIYTLAT